MTNKEKYKQAFSALHVSENFTLEVEKMPKAIRFYRLKTLVAVAAVCALLAAGATAAYAADVGGIQRTVQLWMQGDQTTATIEFDGNGNYQLEYTDDEGGLHRQGGGGVAIGPGGKETPLSEEELLAELAMPDVQYREDGSVWVYWLDQALDITDKFEDGVCYVKLTKDDQTQYMTVKYENGYASSPHKYIPPEEFN